LKRPKHSPDGLRRLREATLRNQPWKHATGPKTPEGKARVAQNGRYAQKDALSRRQLAKQMAECDALAANLAELRRRIGGLMQG
jgi:hypothetical protein